MKQGPLVLPRFSKNINILQGTTTVSLGDFNFFLGHSRRQVRRDIKKLKNMLGYNNAPLVLVQQVHGRNISVLTKKPHKSVSYFNNSDALVTSVKGVLLGILTADCLPVFLFDRCQNAIGLVHAGWRGVAKGIVPATIKKMQNLYQSRPADIIAGIGPHISPRNYEIGARTAGKLGLPAKVKTRADLAGLVKNQLKQTGVPEHAIEITPICTYISRQCYSYRRQGKKAGRLLSFILLK
jgi:polyphenol oxidase